MLLVSVDRGCSWSRARRGQSRRLVYKQCDGQSPSIRTYPQPFSYLLLHPLRSQSTQLGPVGEGFSIPCSCTPTLSKMPTCGCLTEVLWLATRGHESHYGTYPYLEMWEFFEVAEAEQFQGGLPNGRTGWSRRCHSQSCHHSHSPTSTT